MSISTAKSCVSENVQLLISYKNPTYIRIFIKRLSRCRERKAISKISVTSVELAYLTMGMCAQSTNLI